MRIYTPSESNDAGYAVTRFVTDGALYFCRLTEQSVRERMATGQIDVSTAAMLEVSDEITLSLTSVVQVAGLNYRLRGVTRRPLRHVNQYAVEWMDDPMDTTESLWDGAWILDGSRQLAGLNPSLTS